MELPEFLDEETWQDWCQYRLNEVGRKRFGEVAQKRFLKRCEHLHSQGYDVIQLMNYAMDIGWLTIYSDEQFRRKTRPASHSPGPQPVNISVDKDKGKAFLRIARKNVAGH